MTKSTAHRVSESAAESHLSPNLAGPLIEAWIHGGEAYAKAWLAWQEEVLRFVGSRLQWDGRVSAAMAKCRTLSELAEVQQDWAVSTARDYFDEVGRLMQRAAHLAPSWMPRAAARPGAPHAHAAD